MTEYAKIADARLRKLGEAEWEIKSCMQRIEELENVAQCCGSLNITDKVQNSVTGNKMEDAVMKILEEQERLYIIIESYINIDIEINRELEILNPIEREIIIRQYKRKENSDVIAKEMNYSASYIRTIKLKALEKFGKKVKNS